MLNQPRFNPLDRGISIWTWASMDGKTDAEIVSIP